MSFEAKLQEMGYTLKPIELNAGRLMLAVRTGNLVYTSGQVPNRDGRAIKGKVGQDVSVEEGYEAAKLATSCLSFGGVALGHIDRKGDVVGQAVDAVGVKVAGDRSGEEVALLADP